MGIIQLITISLTRMKLLLAVAALADERIIGGSDASSPVPFQVSLQSGGSHFCGASLLSTTHVMSAGHCRISGWQFATVALEGLQSNNLAQQMKISTWVVHPDFTQSAIINYDYSVITLKSAVTLKSGLVETIAVPLMEDSDCAAVWGSFRITPQSQCVGLGGTGSCNGDSGGPLWQEVNGVKYLIGNTSWGSGTCDADVYPTIYSKNSAVIPWIQAQL